MKSHAAPQSRAIRRPDSNRSLTALVLALLLRSVLSAPPSVASNLGLQTGARRVLRQKGPDEERLFVRFTSAATDSGHVQVWTVDIEGKLWTSQRNTEKAQWSRWRIDKSISDVLVGAVAAPVGEKKLQVWAINDVGQVWTKAMTGKMRKKKEDQPKWTEWTKIASLEEEVAEFIASHSDDGLLENWAIDIDGWVRGRDKKPDTSWSDWKTVDTMNERITALVVSPHVSNKQRMWALDSSGRMLMSKRLPVDETDRPWSDWAQVDGVPEIFQFVAAPLSTGHMYLWGVDLNGDIWASGEESLDNGSPYSEWFMLQSPGEPSIHISAATLPNGKLQLWIVDQDGISWSLWETEDGFSAWTNEWQA